MTLRWIADLKSVCTVECVLSLDVSLLARRTRSLRGDVLGVTCGGGVCVALRVHVGVRGDGGLHQEGVPPDAAHRGGLQPRGQHRLQVPGREPRQPGARAVLRERVPGLQCTQVSVCVCVCVFCFFSLPLLSCLCQKS